MLADWKQQIKDLIEPSVARSKTIQTVLIARRALEQTGAIAAQVSAAKTAWVFADEAGFDAAGVPVKASLAAAGFSVRACVLPVSKLPEASVEQSARFAACLAETPDALAVSVGSGVINDLVKFTAYQADRPYISVATAASMDGYTSAGSSLSEQGFKITMPARPPAALIADLDVIAAAPADMTGWGYGDLAGKSPAGGDWVLADAVGAETLQTAAYPMVQDHLKGWLAKPGAVGKGGFDALARLFVGLTVVGFAMETHQSSRPASGAEHQVAHIWEMDGLRHHGKKVSHGAAVSVACIAMLKLYDWLLNQDLSELDIDQAMAGLPALDTRFGDIDRLFRDGRVAAVAKTQTAEKHADPPVIRDRLAHMRLGWMETHERLWQHLYRAEAMAAMLRAAGSPVSPGDIGLTEEDLVRTIRAAVYIRPRYTILDFLHETGQFERALAETFPATPQTSVVNAG